MKWSNNTTITIQTIEGPKDVPAKCKGIFAITKSTSDFGIKKGLYNLTHIPTGCSILCDTTKGRIYRAVKRFEHLDWDGVEMDSEPPKTFDRDKFSEIRFMYS